jgi:hypothetical protein
LRGGSQPGPFRMIALASLTFWCPAVEEQVNV